LRVGILGGVFNPPHIGHLICAQEAHSQLELEVVVFVPVGEAPHREVEQDPGPELRLRMCDYAIAADARFAASRIELDRSGPSYTVDTLRELREQAPERDLFLILGADQAAALPAWRQPEEVLELATVAVAERDGRRREEVRRSVASLPAAPHRLVFFDMPRVDVSSTVVRRRAAEGLPIRYLVPDKVASFIEAQSLYGSSTPVAAE
jgi:nicotinate-nucleotide adenylyltransferase